MNRLFGLLAVVALMTMHVLAAGYEKDVWRALSQGAEFDIWFRVVDELGSPVAGAKCSGWMYLERNRNHGEGYSLLTDTNGFVRVKGTCGEWVSVLIRKEGYYRTMFERKYPVRGIEPSVQDGKWQPYGETRTVVLKKINQLGKLVIPDVGRPEVRSRKIPKFDCWIPFDLEKFDWNAPFGSGVHPDVLLRFRNRTTEFYYDFTYCMDVCFTNNPFAGVCEMKKDLTSDMKTSYKADPGAEYRSSFTYTSERTRDRKRKDDYLNDDAYLVFRTRTTVDAHGRLKSAHYGTLHGVWMSARDHMVLKDGCFNATANDLDIEDGYYLREKVKHYAE